MVLSTDMAGRNPKGCERFYRELGNQAHHRRQGAMDSPSIVVPVIKGAAMQLPQLHDAKVAPLADDPVA